MTSYYLKLWQFPFVDSRLTNLLWLHTIPCDPWFLWQPGRQLAPNWIERWCDPWFLWQPGRQLAPNWIERWCLARKDSRSVHIFCTWNSSCVGSDIRIGSWSMGTYCMYTSTDSYIAAYVGQCLHFMVYYSMTSHTSDSSFDKPCWTTYYSLCAVAWHFDLTVDDW